MSRNPYTLSLRWGSGPSAIVLTDIDFVVDTETTRPHPRDDFEVRIVALAIDGMQQRGGPLTRWASAVTDNLLMSNDRLLSALVDWAQDAILADGVFCAARVEEAREAAAESPEPYADDWSDKLSPEDDRE